MLEHKTPSHMFTDELDELDLEIDLGSDEEINLLPLTNDDFEVELGPDDLLLKFDNLINVDQFQDASLFYGDDEELEVSLAQDEKDVQAIAEAWKKNNDATFEKYRVYEETLLTQQYRNQKVAANSSSKVSVLKDIVTNLIESGENLFNKTDKELIFIIGMHAAYSGPPLVDPSRPDITIAQQQLAKRTLENVRLYIQQAMQLKETNLSLPNEELSELHSVLRARYADYITGTIGGYITNVFVDEQIDPIDTSKSKLTYTLTCNCGEQITTNSLGEVLKDRALFGKFYCTGCDNYITFDVESMRAIQKEITEYTPITSSSGGTTHTLATVYDIPTYSLTLPYVTEQTKFIKGTISETFAKEIENYIVKLENSINKIRLLDYGKVAKPSFIQHVAKLKGMTVETMRDVMRGAVYNSHFFRSHINGAGYTVETLSNIIDKIDSCQGISYTNVEDFQKMICSVCGRKLNKRQIFLEAPYTLDRISTKKLRKLIDDYKPVQPSLTIAEQADAFLSETIFFRKEDAKYNKSVLYYHIPNIDEIIEPYLLKVAMVFADEYLPVFYDNFRTAENLVKGILTKEGRSDSEPMTNDPFKKSIAYYNSNIFINRIAAAQLRALLTDKKNGLDKEAICNKAIMLSSRVLANTMSKIKESEEPFKEHPEIYDILLRATNAISSGWGIKWAMLNVILNDSDVFVRGMQKLVKVDVTEVIPPPNKDNKEAFGPRWYFKEYITQVEAPINHTFFEAVFGRTQILNSTDEDEVTIDLDEIIEEALNGTEYSVDIYEVYKNGSDRMKEMINRLGVYYEPDSVNK